MHQSLLPTLFVLSLNIFSTHASLPYSIPDLYNRQFGRRHIVPTKYHHHNPPDTYPSLPPIYATGTGTTPCAEPTAPPHHQHPSPPLYTSPSHTPHHPGGPYKPPHHNSTTLHHEHPHHHPTASPYPSTFIVVPSLHHEYPGKPPVNTPSLASSGHLPASTKNCSEPTVVAGSTTVAQPTGAYKQTVVAAPSSAGTGGEKCGKWEYCPDGY